MPSPRSALRQATGSKETSRRASLSDCIEVCKFESEASEGQEILEVVGSDSEASDADEQAAAATEVNSTAARDADADNEEEGGWESSHLAKAAERRRVRRSVTGNLGSGSGEMPAMQSSAIWRRRFADGGQRPSLALPLPAVAAA